MRDKAATAYLGTMGDPPNVDGALWATRMSNVMALMAQGLVDLGFIGGAEVDRHGNLNTSYVGDPSRPRVKLPGSGGGADIAILSRRWVTLMSHEPRRLVERGLREAGLSAVGWRTVPVDEGALGNQARQTRPDVVQVLIEQLFAGERVSPDEFDHADAEFRAFGDVEDQFAALRPARQA